MGMKVATTWMPPPIPFARPTVSQSGEPSAQDLRKAVHEQGAGEEIEEVDEGTADVDGEHEHQVHGQEKDRDTQRPVEHDPVDAIGEAGRDLALLFDDVPDQGMGEAVAGVCEQDVDLVGQIAGDGRELLLRYRIADQIARQVVALE